MNIRSLLAEPNRKWRTRAPADEAKIADLIREAQISLPAEYLDLLRVTDGGEGNIALSPLYLQLYSVDECIETLRDPSVKYCLESPDALNRPANPDFFIFASNGGLESIAFDLRCGSTRPVVMIDLIAGSESAKQIAPDIVTFINAIGLEAGQ